MLRRLRLKLTTDLLAKALVIAAIGLACVFAGMVVTGVFRQQRDLDRGTRCLENVLRLTDAADAYARDHGGRLPPAREWCDRLRPYLKDAKAFVCPATRNQRCSYAFNANLSQVRLASIREPGGVVLFFESDRGWNAAGGPELLPTKPRHRFGSLDGWAFANGDAMGSRRAEMKAPECWQPQPQAAGKAGRQGRSRGYPGREGAPARPR